MRAPVRVGVGVRERGDDNRESRLGLVAGRRGCVGACRARAARRRRPARHPSPTSRL